MSAWINNPTPVGQAVRREFEEKITSRWTHTNSSGGKGCSRSETECTCDTGRRRVNEALATIDDALAKLGKRTGARAVAARDYLVAQRSTLTAALGAFESVGADLDGASFVEVCDRLERAIANAVATERALKQCDDLSRLRELHDAADRARVERNIALKAKDALLAAATLPRIPDLDPFSVARAQSHDLAMAARSKAKPMAALHMALDQGRAASLDVARLWVCFENGASEFFDNRCARYLEREAE